MSSWKEPVNLSRAALIVVDMQNDFCHEKGANALNGGKLSRHQGIVPNIRRVISAAHAAGIPVVFVKTTHDESTDSPPWLTRRRGRKHPTCVTGTWGTEYFGVAPVAGDVEIVKHRYSAFIGTGLELTLRAMGVNTILLTGVSTDVCVESTMRDGFMLDFYTVLLKDCTAAGSDAAYQGTLASMDPGFGWISDSVEASELLRQCRAQEPPSAIQESTHKLL